VVFSVQSIPELHNENQLDKPGSWQSFGGRKSVVSTLGLHY
jgi:hypothetical protein